MSMRSRWLAELSDMAPKLAGTLGTSGVSAMLGLVSGTLAARILGPESRGELAQLLLWPQLVATVGILGLELASTYLSADPARRKNVPATALTMALGQSVVLVAIYLALVPLLFHGTGVVPQAMLMAALIPMYLVGAVCIDCLAGTLRFGAFNVVRITLPIIYCGGTVALAMSGALTSTSGALVFLGAHALGDLLALAFVWRGGGLGAFDRAIARDAVRFGLRAHFGRLTPQSLGVDTAIIALMLTSRDVGMYAAATAFLAAPSLVASSISMVVYPHVSAAHQSGTRPQLEATFLVYAAAVAFIAITLGAFAGPIVTLFFGQPYADAATALRFLAVASVALSLRSFPIEVLRGVGRPGLTSIAEAASWAIFLCAIPIGGAMGGLAGTAAAVAAASVASLGVLALLIWRSGAFARAAASFRGDPAEVPA